MIIMNFDDLRRKVEEDFTSPPLEQCLAWIREVQQEMWNRLTPEEQQRIAWEHWWHMPTREPPPSLD